MTEIKAITSDKVSDSREAELDSLFSNMPDEAEVTINLPSKGRFYPTQGPITINSLKYEDEERILRAKSKGSDTINSLLKNCVTGLDIPDLLQMDKLYLLLKVREVSYGAEYKFSMGCPHCSTDVTTQIDIANGLGVVEVDDNLEDPRTVKLPKLGVEATVRFPRVRDEQFIADNESLSKNLYRFVQSINGNSDSVFINKALKRMHIMDIKKIMKEVLRGEYGVDPRFMFDCPSCKESSTMAIPLDIDFFSVS